MLYKNYTIRFKTVFPDFTTFQTKVDSFLEFGSSLVDENLFNITLAIYGNNWFNWDVEPRCIVETARVWNDNISLYRILKETYNKSITDLQKLTGTNVNTVFSVNRVQGTVTPNFIDNKTENTTTTQKNSLIEDIEMLKKQLNGIQTSFLNKVRELLLPYQEFISDDQQFQFIENL